MRTRTALLAALLFALPSAGAAQTIDHLEILAPPKLTRCDPSRPFFRVVVNAVDASGNPVALGVGAAEAKKLFKVTEGGTSHPVLYVGLGESGATSGLR